jgi:hypothetical protein
MTEGLDLENGGETTVQGALEDSGKDGTVSGGKTLDKLESSLSVRNNPFADRESKSLTWTNINMILVRWLLVNNACSSCVKKLTPIAMKQLHVNHTYRPPAIKKISKGIF